MCSASSDYAVTLARRVTSARMRADIVSRVTAYARLSNDQDCRLGSIASIFSRKKPGSRVFREQRPSVVTTENCSTLCGEAIVQKQLRIDCRSA